MAKNTNDIEQNSTKIIISKEELNNILDDRILKGYQILSKRSINQTEFKTIHDDFILWDDFNSEFLKHAFNKENNEYKIKYDKAGKFYYAFIDGKTSFEHKNEEFKFKVHSKLQELKKLRAKTSLLKSTIVEKFKDTDKTLTIDKSKVFIVHGHDEEAKIKTARLIEKLGLKPIILNEQVSRSKTIIEKIEEYSNVGFGIVLYTPCDIGAKDEEIPKFKKRARQNVVFEHGFLIGKIGRENVCALVKGEIETPNDISGVVYVKMDNEEAWHLKIAKELKNSGYNIDMNNL